jgi:GTP-binding protein Era
VSEEAPFRSGFAVILGRPNAGKSTLLNALVGEKITIVSSKPQTTRDKIQGILSRDDFQLVLVDTPGIMEPKDRLNEALMESVRNSLDGIDVVLHLIDSTEKAALSEAELAVVRSIPCPRIVVATKMDLVSNFDLAEWGSRGELGPRVQTLSVSVVSGVGLEDLVAAAVKHLPEGEPLYDPEDLTDRDKRFLAGEAIREKVFELTGQELPYATAVLIDEYREPEEEGEKTYIGATIYVERDSQKGMVVGKQGRMIKEIGQLARADIEGLLGAGVFLDLRVKVRKDWRKRDPDLKMFGYQPPKPRRGARR